VLVRGLSGASGVAISADGFGLVREIPHFLSLSFPRRKCVGLLRVFIADRVQCGPCQGLPPSQCVHRHVPPRGQLRSVLNTPTEAIPLPPTPAIDDRMVLDPDKNDKERERKEI
jgi:hypothetical protein